MLRSSIDPCPSGESRKPAAGKLAPRKRWLGLLACLAFVPFLIAADPACQVQQARELYGVEIVLLDQDWDELSLQAVNDALAKLPPHVVNQLGNRFSGRLYVLCNDESRTMSGASIFPSGANFFYNNDGRNEIVLYPQQGTLTVLHEMGHAYQLRMAPAGRYAWLFFEAEIRDFMKVTGWTLDSTDEELAAALDQTQLRFSYSGKEVWMFMSHFDPLEDYANSFAMFFYNPNKLLEISPERYEWMRKNVGTDRR